MKSIKYVYTLLFAALLCTPILGAAQGKDKAALRAEIKYIIDSSGAKVGVGMMGLDFNDSLTINNEHHYPMHSVFKFPLALAVLKKVDRGELKLDQKIHIAKEDLDQDTWSPMVKKFPNQSIDIKLSDLLALSVSKSDNNACDALFRLLGGVHPVNNYVHALGVKQMMIVANEAAMKAAWPVQYKNWCQPTAMLQLLRIFYNERAVSKANTDYLMKLMLNSVNADRLRGQLPPGTKVAHKTGTSDTNTEGYTAATNDVGIITLPNGHHVAVVVYISDYKGGIKKGEHIIASITKCIWNYLQ